MLQFFLGRQACTVYSFTQFYPMCEPEEDDTKAMMVLSCMQIDN